MVLETLAGFMAVHPQQVLHVATSSRYEDGRERFMHYQVGDGTDIIAAAPREGEDDDGSLCRGTRRRKHG